MEPSVASLGPISVTSSIGLPTGPTNGEFQIDAEQTTANRGLFRPSAPNLRRAHTIAQGLRRDVTLKAARERTFPSLLRVKDSHEVLRDRSRKRSNTHGTSPAGLAGGREATHFTVGNVGQNGRIYLRPVGNYPQQESWSPPFVSQAVAQPTSQGTSSTKRACAGSNSSRWSNSQLSELRPHTVVEEIDEDGESVITDSGISEHAHCGRARAHSFSTISEHRSAVESQAQVEFRIVIDRFDERPKSAEGYHRPTLEVPIPHYRLGRPQFNTEGSAILRSSLYTRTSVSDQAPSYMFQRSRSDALFPFSTGREGTPPGRPSLAISVFSGTPGIDLSGSCDTEQPLFYKLNEPIDPSIFESLFGGMDDPAVVRYIPGTKDISAATPARIVAQVSSESFMDYELVSDFFLTFRSYLSPNSLLSLLLARLQWAINRLQDDGRIIRIRTFAALRHWILNYFFDDFVPNHDLRVQFCDAINQMYDQVKARDHGGTSDLKILIDLKRCWYGKRSMYWNGSRYPASCNDPDSAIVPGDAEAEGVDIEGKDQRKLGQHTLSRDEDNFQPAADGLGFLNLGKVGYSAISAQRKRSDSAGTSKSVPFSARSDQSFQVTSCSLPSKTSNRQSSPCPSGNAPHPVPFVKTSTSPRNHLSISPMLSRYRPLLTHAHKRSGSFSDSVRDGRPPLTLPRTEESGEATRETLDYGLFIRGELFPPADSHVTMMAPPSPPLPIPESSEKLSSQSPPKESPKIVTSSSGVRTIIGSIRRALHNRSGPTRSENIAVSKAMKGKTSALPTNLAFGSGLYRDRKTTTTARRVLKIDVLCDEVLKQYRGIIQQHGCVQDEASLPQPLQETGQKHGSSSSSVALRIPSQGTQRALSDVTLGSESIVIVDDTGLDIPAMSGALDISWVASEQRQARRTPEIAGPGNNAAGHFSLSQPSLKFSRAEDKYSLPIYYDSKIMPGIQYLPSSALPVGTQRRSYSVERRSDAKKTSLSIRLRKYASFQSFRSRIRFTLGEAGHRESEGPVLPSEMGHALRRRPGGNLRNAQKVGDLRPEIRPKSFISDVTQRHSVAGSTLTAQKDRQSLSDASGAPNSRFSLLLTHSSQNLRPSFEAIIAQFAHIPDDDDGGIESTLLKLEGKWKPSGHMTADNSSRLPRLHDHGRSSKSEERAEHEWAQDNHGLHSPEELTAQLEKHLGTSRPFLGDCFAPSQSRNYSLADSEYSYDSILLERGLSDESMKRPTGTSLILRPSNERYSIPTRDTSDLASSHPSIDVVKDSNSLRWIARHSDLAIPSENAFRRHVREQFTYTSSDLSVDAIEARDVTQERLSIQTQSSNASSRDMPAHPLAHPLSPPNTSFDSSHSLKPAPLHPQPLTPEVSPVHRIKENEKKWAIEEPQVSRDVRLQIERGLGLDCTKSLLTYEHIPFVLSCESKVLAEQLTLVERAALGEIDWRDLVDMRWGEHSSEVLNWVQFLSEEDQRGIDLVMSRFNLMVKWVLSEIVLTQDIEERARTVTKYIHTAFHAKKISNFATMIQIVLALSSTDCSRLQKTWDLVSPEDRSLFRDMESLIQPLRNFHNLRVEMETANVRDGCIPFVGLYVHDLTYNAQKPAQISSTRDGEPLINFERYRTASRIVKSLLRLIDASARYNIEPVQGILERCLWIACLSEEDICARSKELE